MSVVRETGWALSLAGIGYAGLEIVASHTREGEAQMEVKRIGVDLAKNVFEIHGGTKADEGGNAVIDDQPETRPRGVVVSG